MMPLQSKRCMLVLVQALKGRPSALLAHAAPAPEHWEPMDDPATAVRFVELPIETARAAPVPARATRGAARLWGPAFPF